MLRTKVDVTWTDAANKPQCARFSDHGTAMRFARAQSAAPFPTCTEAADKTGLIGQFKNGKPTAEFAHLDMED